MPWRSLRRSPAFTLAAVLLLAIGIGGATVLFTVTDALLLEPLAVPRPGELARITELIPGRPPALYLEWDEFEEWQQRTRSFASAFAAYDVNLALEEGAVARVVHGGLLSPNYFDALGVRPAVGHLPRQDDELLLGYGFWQGEFHGDPAITGRAIRVNRHAFTIAGVMPRGFNGISLESGPALHLPFGAARLLFRDGDPRKCCGWEVAGRLRPGVTPEAAASETQASLQAALIAAAERAKPLSAEDRGYIERRKFRVDSVEHGVSRLRDRFGVGLLTLFSGAVLLLLLACANIAGMMVARAAAREREMALRSALGATRGRLVRLWLAESSLVAAMGAVAGLALVLAALPMVARSMPPLRDLASELVTVSLDLHFHWRVFAFACGLCALAALLAGLAPAWHAARASLNESLKAGAGDPRRSRLRGALTIVQVAICTVVLANSALLVATLRALYGSPVGFDRDRIVTFTVDRAEPGDLAARLQAEVRQLPGVEQAALAARPLMRGSGFKTSVGLPGTRNGRDLNSSQNTVAPEYFAAMGMRLVRGRNLRSGDGEPDRKPRAVVVNDAFVRRFFPEGDPIGRTYGIGFDRLVTPDIEIVGVVTDTRYRSLREPFQPIAYSCFCDAAVRTARGFTLEVRSFGRPEEVVAPVREALRRLDASASFREIRTMAEDMDDSLWAERTLAAMGAGFAAVAALVAAIGLYGLLSYTLAQRRRELGIRMALGATRAQVARAVVAPVAVLIAAGSAVGIAIALYTGRLLQDVLWEVKPADPRVHAAACAVLLASAAAAAALPALRAARTDPAQTLREN